MKKYGIFFGVLLFLTGCSLLSPRTPEAIMERAWESMEAQVAFEMSAEAEGRIYVDLHKVTVMFPVKAEITGVVNGAEVQGEARVTTSVAGNEIDEKGKVLLAADNTLVIEPYNPDYPKWEMEVSLWEEVRSQLKNVENFKEATLEKDKKEGIYRITLPIEGFLSDMKPLKSAALTFVVEKKTFLLKQVVITDMKLEKTVEYQGQSLPLRGELNINVWNTFSAAE